MKRFLLSLLSVLAFGCSQNESSTQESKEEVPKPNILFIMSDDHAMKAISAYSKELIRTPNIDRIAQEGALMRNAFVTNSICAPSRAAILTGKYSHLNGLRDNRDEFDGSQMIFPKLLKTAGYQTYLIGKWHLKSKPQGFDFWKILIDQGEYYNPRLVSENDTTVVNGYTTDVITDEGLSVLQSRDKSKPFVMLLQHKAPHRNWQPNIKHFRLFEEDLPIPATLYDDYKGRQALAEQDQQITNMWLSNDLKLTPDYYEEETGTGGAVGPSDPESSYAAMLNRMTEEQRVPWDAYYDSVGLAFKSANLSGKELWNWKYQRYIKDYLKCIVSVDENVGRVLDYLEAEGLAENTIVVYTSDQGFYLGEHGMYDKRFMYEESFRTPMLIKYPKGIRSGTSIEELVMNIDFAPTFLDYAGVEIPKEMQGLSMRPLFEARGERPEWRESVYYHYYEYPHGWHKVKRHYGIRNYRYKLIHFYHDVDTWELYDLQQDPQEMNNLIDDPKYGDVVEELKAKLIEKQIELNEQPEIIDLTRGEEFIGGDRL
ncbi:sulfatase [Imperialibacter roseus]|uniref:Sulfatase n=1 Tax=Imperialibacter roseus TaxID=1324217 RepID=A0ABZ0IK70_9BACT|nr:sulfatase [Imperialibacter roseus]WOK05419.1 sulfatase [Imperialibacter roseus]